MFNFSRNLMLNGDMPVEGPDLDDNGGDDEEWEDELPGDDNSDDDE